VAEGHGSFQDIVRRRQQARFVGRDEQLAGFRANLALPVDHPDRRFVFSIHGDGGVGKTFLTGQLRRIAVERGAAAGYVDENVFSVPEAMHAMAVDLAAQGEKLKGFTKLYDAYLQRRREVEADPGAPTGIGAFLTRTTVKAGLHAAHAIPAVGGLADSVDAAELAEQADRLRVFLGSKFHKHEDVQLLLSPVAVLTPAFVRDVAEIGRRRVLALFFDTYEQTGPVLDDWLRTVLDGGYGDLPQDLVVTVAGRSALDPGQWAPFLGLLADVPLAPFSEAEARQLLAGKGVTEERVVRVVLAVSNRLPLLVAMLAENQPADPAAVGDPSGDAVDRFLKWESDPQRRALALAAALPRTVDEDVLAALLGSGIHSDIAGDGSSSAPLLFGWLRRLPFVSHQSGRCQYHEVVRSAMIRLERGQSPARWKALHSVLAEQYAQWRAAVRESDAWSDAAWQALRVEESYHRLCADPAKGLAEALAAAVHACADSPVTAGRWAQMLTQAGDDADAGSLSSWGRRLETSLRAPDNEARIACLSLLLDSGNLPDPVRALALRTRGWALYFLDRDAEAVGDLNSALLLEPRDSLALARRGEAYRWLKRYPEALADFDRAIELDPSDAWAIGSRGQAYQAMGRHDEALTDLDHAIGLDPTADWTIAHRGETYRLIHRYDEALADFSRAIELSPDYTWAIGSRGQTYQAMGRHDEALADFDRAIELDPTVDWTIADRGETYRLTERYPEALADFDRAIELNPDYTWTIARRGEVYRMTERYPEALADFDRAIGLDPAADWTIAHRGETYRLTERYPEALADFSRAIEVNPDYAWAIAYRGETYRQMKRYPEALADFDRAVELDSGDAWAIGSRGQAYQAMERYDEALADFDRAIALDSTADWIIECRGATYLAMKRYPEALADFDQAIELDPNNAEAIANRNTAHRFIQSTA